VLLKILLIVWLASLVVGIISVVRAKLPVAPGWACYGRSARVVGVLLMLPLPAAFVANVAIELLLAFGKVDPTRGIGASDPERVALVIYVLVYSLAVLAAVGGCEATRSERKQESGGKEPGPGDPGDDACAAAPQASTPPEERIHP
jgi:hypothetical protein